MIGCGVTAVPPLVMVVGTLLGVVGNPVATDARVVASTELRDGFPLTVDAVEDDAAPGPRDGLAAPVGMDGVKIGETPEPVVLPGVVEPPPAAGVELSLSQV